MNINAALDAKAIEQDERNEQIDGAALLFAISNFLGRFVAYPSEHAQNRAYPLDRTHPYDGGMGDDATSRLSLAGTAERQD